MKFLLDNCTHPTVDAIYTGLHASMPTLSKTTVYNTLKLLVEKGAVNQLTIDERNACYDADTSQHAHFLCNCCGRLMDVPVEGISLSRYSQLPEGTIVESSQLYFKGLCPECAARAAAESN